jgi:bifunctional non-homologous end joining protein LigD
VRAE